MIDTFQKYPNTLGFSVAWSGNSSSSVQMMKAVVVHSKEYIKSRGYRSIPIGFTNSGLDRNVNSVPEYMNCEDPDKSIDFYSWGLSKELYAGCTNSSSLFPTGLVEQYAKYSIPLIAHYGCEAKAQHDFAEVLDIYGNTYTKVLSGGIVHEWLEDWDSGADLGKKLSFHLYCAIV
jgi:hypothetical protein